MPNPEPSSKIDPWVGIIIIIRVTITIIVWLGLFLSIFLGYFTVPILIIGLVSLIYMLSDFGVFVAIRREQQALEERKKMLGIQPDEKEKRE